ncbi:TSUP family transporter, partial [Pseudomonas qingdaonensis]
LSGAIIWPLALAMALAAFLGAQLGARCAVRFGSRLIKPLLVSVCCIMALKLLLDTGNPLGDWLNQFF